MIPSAPFTCSVLLIDDETVAEDLIGYRLGNGLDFTLRYDHRAHLAVELCREVGATTVIVDLRMPGTNGFEVIQMLRAQHDTCHIPIILLSSEDDAEVKARAFALGANDYMVKWPDRREVEARVRYHTGAYLARLERDAAFESLRQREEELRLSQAALHQAQKMEAIGQLTGGVAHDFNNVLQIISSNLNLLKRLPGVAEIGGPRIESALRAVSQGGKLATHLLAFARRQPLENELVDLAALLRSVDDMVGTLLRPRTEVSTHIEAGLWSTVIDSGQLTNVLLNLAINARDAMGEGGRLEISARNIAAGAEVLQGSLGDYIGIDIADNGSGMAPEVLRRAFEPFFTTKPVGKGTGLGLSMVYGFISQSGGKMAIASQENVGTRISIFLRKSETDPLVAQAGHSALAVSEQGVETILVVEDDDLVRAAGVEFLSSLGYRVWSAANADEAVALINGGALFDLVFTDVIMPGETDVLALRELVHRKLPACQMLFTSGYAEGKLVHAGKVMPGIMLLHKPYTLEALAARIRHIFGEDGQAALF